MSFNLLSIPQDPVLLSIRHMWEGMIVCCDAEIMHLNILMISPIFQDSLNSGRYISLKCWQWIFYFGLKFLCRHRRHQEENEKFPEHRCVSLSHIQVIITGFTSQGSLWVIWLDTSLSILSKFKFIVQQVREIIDYPAHFGSSLKSQSSALTLGFLRCDWEREQPKSNLEEVDQKKQYGHRMVLWTREKLRWAAKHLHRELCVFPIQQVFCEGQNLDDRPWLPMAYYDFG